MKIIKIALPLLVVIAIALALLAPIGPLPGFFIGGNETAVPESWPDTSELHEIRLKVPGTIPRVVIIWVIDYQGDLFVVGNRSSGWVKMLGEDGSKTGSKTGSKSSSAALRIKDNTYSVRATAVSTGWEPVMQAYVEKYQADYPDIVAGFPDIAEAQSQIAVFRLEG